MAGRRRKWETRRPADEFRYPAFARVLKQLAAPELSLFDPNPYKFTRLLSERYGIDISPSQFRAWWIGKHQPASKSLLKLKQLVYPEVNSYSLRTHDVRELFTWLSPSTDKPMQRFFCAMDAFCWSTGNDPKEKRRANQLSAEVIDALCRSWSPQSDRAQGYQSSATAFTYGSDALDGDSELKLQPKDYMHQFKILEAQWNQAFDAFNPNSVVMFLLAVGTFHALPTEKQERAWALDLASGLLALWVHGVVRETYPKAVYPGNLAHLGQWSHLFITYEDLHKRLFEDLATYGLPFEATPEEILEALLLARDLYFDQLKMFGVDWLRVMQKCCIPFVQGDTLPRPIYMVDEIDEV